MFISVTTRIQEFGQMRTYAAQWPCGLLRRAVIPRQQVTLRISVRPNHRNLLSLSFRFQWQQFLSGLLVHGVLEQDNGLLRLFVRERAVL